MTKKKKINAITAMSYFTAGVYSDFTIKCWRTQNKSGQ